MTGIPEIDAYSRSPHDPFPGDYSTEIKNMFGDLLNPDGKLTSLQLRQASYGEDLYERAKADHNNAMKAREKALNMFKDKIDPVAWRQIADKTPGTQLPIIIPSLALAGAYNNPILGTHLPSDVYRFIGPDDGFPIDCGGYCNPLTGDIFLNKGYQGLPSYRKNTLYHEVAHGFTPTLAPSFSFRAKAPAPADYVPFVYSPMSDVYGPDSVSPTYAMQDPAELTRSIGQGKVHMRRDGHLDDRLTTEALMDYIGSTPALVGRPGNKHFRSPLGAHVPGLVAGDQSGLGDDLLGLRWDYLRHKERSSKSYDPNERYGRMLHPKIYASPTRMRLQGSPIFPIRERMNSTRVHDLLHRDIQALLDQD